MLPDVLQKDLKIVFCGTAAGDRSARLKMYYAGRGNKFWKILHEVGLTQELFTPKQYADLPRFGIGLTDLVKHASGVDSQIDFKIKGCAELREKILFYQPKILCFNGKKAAQEFLSRSVDLGLQSENIGVTKLFVASSTSGAASGYWDLESWLNLASII